MHTTAVSPGSVADRLQGDRAGVRLHRVTRWALAGIVAAGVGLGLFAWIRRDDTPETRYLTQPVTRGDLRVTVTATGTLAPTNQVEVGSELSGIVKSVEVDYDQRVKVGQVLARLDATKLEAQIGQTGAALAAARARVEQAVATEAEARAQLARAEELAARELLAPSDLDTARATGRRAEADRKSAAAAVAQAEAALQAIRTDLAKTTIRSPIDGVVLTRAVEPGQTVAASFQAPVLFTLAEDLTQMELDVDVDEADVGQVAPGLDATFTVDAYADRTFTARVAAVRFASQKTDEVVTYKAILYVDNPDLLLRPGMTATAELVVRHLRNVTLVPNAALRFTPPAETATAAGGGSLIGRLMPRPPTPSSGRAANTGAAGRPQRVFVLRDGRPFAVPITVGSTDGRVSEVIDGEAALGEPVIVETAAKGSGS
jgi:HlyD family secretion protein